MPTKDGGKPTSRRRPTAAGKGLASTTRTARTGKRTPSDTQTPTQRTPRRRTTRPASVTSGTSGAPAAQPAPAAQEPREEAPEGAPAAAVAPGVTAALPAEGAEIDRVLTGTAEEGELEASAPRHHGERGTGTTAGEESRRRRERRGAGTNALGVFIERQFAGPISPAHSYSDLERRSGISREALSRYVTARADRRRSPTIDTLVAIADALHVSLESVARAAGASVKGVIPPPEDVEHAREEALGALVAALSDEQFSAVVELLRQLRPPLGA